MYLDLMDVLRAPGNAVQKAIAIAPEELEEAGVVEPVHGTVQAQNARQSVVVDGSASASVEMECARCLRSFTQPMNLELEAVAPMSFFAATTGIEVDADEVEDELDVELAAIFQAHSVNVTELVRQAVELQRPIQALCSPDCPGLPEAPVYRAEADPRWEALRKLAPPDGVAER